MVDISSEIIINRPIEIVSGYSANPDNAPEWYVNIKSANWKTPKPLQKGSQITFTAKFLGKELIYTYEIIEFIPKEKLIMRTAQGPFPMETTYTWQIINSNHTKMILRNTGQPSGFSKLFAPFMAMAMKKANRKDLQNLKQLLESES